jgi:outer membrane protein
MKPTHRAIVIALGTIALGVTAVASAPAVQQGGPQKFAYVKSKEILSRAPGRAAAEQQYAKERDGFEKIVKQMSDSMEAMFAAFQKEESKLDSATKETRRKGLQDKQSEYRQRTQQLEDQAQQRQYELMQPIMNQVRDVLDQLRTEGNYAFIFDVEADGNPIVAVDRNLDLTERVIARLKPVAIPTTPTVAPGGKASGAKPDSAKPAGPRPAPAGVTKPIKP